MNSFNIGDIILGKYEVTALHRNGGLGVSLAAHHRELDEPVALKFLLPTYLAEPGVATRFAQEALDAMRVNSEHVAAVREVDTVGGAPFIVTEHLDGASLAEVLPKFGRLAISTAADLILQAIEAVHEAHTLGIVHGNLKPSNLFITMKPDDTPCVKVLDFGVSRSIALAERVLLTVDVDTPQYVSPEQLFLPDEVDARADVWSLGAILYETVLGAPPFAGESFTKAWLAILCGEYEAPRGLPRELEELLVDALRFDPKTRVPTVEAFAARLSAFATDAGRASYVRIERAAAGRLPS